LDTWTLEEVFGFQVYTLPLPVRGRLANLTRPPHVADLGANIGLAALFFSRQLEDCTGTAYEPDEVNADFLARCLSANGLNDRWTIVRACASTTDGHVRFMT